MQPELYSHVPGAQSVLLVQISSIDNEFRVFQMEVIAGEPNLEAEVKQHGATFCLDFSRVRPCQLSQPASQPALPGWSDLGLLPAAASVITSMLLL